MQDGWDMRLSPHFTLDEFTATWRPEAARNAELATTGPYMSQMMRLCEDILEPMRAAFGGQPVRITSGFRYAEQVCGFWSGLDVAIRGSSESRTYRPISQHTRGEAADLHVAGYDERTVWEWIWRESPNPFGQVIIEREGRHQWVHVSIPGRAVSDGRWIYGEVLDYDAARSRGQRFHTIDHVDRWGGRGR